jgi:peptide/nickel transport system permease protein
MLWYVIRRTLYGVPILVGVTLFTFFLFYLSSTPEQMARRNLSAHNPSKAQIQAWIKQHGYDQPKSQQFKAYMTDLFLFRFGKSDVTGEDIGQRLKSGIGPSLEVNSLSFVAGLITDIFFAVYFAYYRNTYIDNWGRILCVMAMSITSVLYIIAGQYVFGIVLKLWPIAGFRPGLISWRFVALPAFIGVVAGFGGSVRLYRTFLLEEINQDYVRTARAKGVAEGKVLFQHVLKNAAIPFITSIVLSIPFLITGSLLTESFFGIPGIGNITVEAVFGQDFSTVRAVTFFYTILYIIGAIMTDVCYALADPRVRLE